MYTIIHLGNNIILFKTVVRALLYLLNITVLTFVTIPPMSPTLCTMWEQRRYISGDYINAEVSKMLWKKHNAVYIHLQAGHNAQVTH